MDKNGHNLSSFNNTLKDIPRGNTLDELIQHDREYVKENLVKDLKISEEITAYNASFKLEHRGRSRGTALMVHGLSDAPYSMKATGEYLADEGFDIVVMRLPGHGTEPACLLDITWEDWYKAFSQYAEIVRAEKGESEQILLCGFSTGAALCVRYAMEHPAYVSGLLLFSPAFGVSPFAVITNMHKPLSLLQPFEKFAWLEIGEENDPYKYVSFPKNAAYQVYRLTKANERMERELKSNNCSVDIPMTVFQSAFDATVNPERSVIFGKDLFKQKTVYLYGYNPGMKNLFKKDPEIVVQKLLDMGHVRLLPEGKKWPDNTASLSHIALLFSDEDPWYGIHTYGNAVLGEKKTLDVQREFNRVRYNPFFDEMREIIDEEFMECIERRE